MRIASAPRAIVAALVICACAAACSSALATPRSVSQLRRSFGRVFVAMRLSGNVSACSDATSQGQRWLIEYVRGQERYLPSTTCQEAVAGVPGLLSQPSDCYRPIAAQLMPFVRTAIIHVTGGRATVQLTNDTACEEGHGEESEHMVTGRSAVRLDTLGTTHWIMRRKRWLFNDEPTGTYSAAGRKAAALLRTALTGSTITETYPENPPFPDITGAAFCANGSTQVTLFSHLVPGGTWYVAGGYSVLTRAPGPAFDAQGNPKGSVFVYTPASLEWAVTLAGGKITATQPPYPVALLPNVHLPSPVFTPGDAGC